MSENTESTTKPEVVQSPVAEQPATQPAPVVADKTPEAAQAAPSASTDEISKSNLAFIKMRQEKKEAKRRIAELEAKLAAASKPAEPEATPAAVPAVAAEQKAIQAAPQAEPENAEKTALESLARDKDLSSISGGMVEVMDLLDGDARLTRIYAIDPGLALREAKAMYLAKIGVSTKPSSAPVAAPPAGGIRANSKDLSALLAAIDKAHPGTKEFNDLVAQINKASIG